MAFKSEHKTRRDVNDPMNLLLKFSKLMKNERYAISKINHDGINIVIIWFVYFRLIVMVNIYREFVLPDLASALILRISKLLDTFSPLKVIFRPLIN